MTEKQHVPPFLTGIDGKQNDGRIDSFEEIYNLPMKPSELSPTGSGSAREAALKASFEYAIDSDPELVLFGKSGAEKGEPSNAEKEPGHPILGNHERFKDYGQRISIEKPATLNVETIVKPVISAIEHYRGGFPSIAEAEATPALIERVDKEVVRSLCEECEALTKLRLVSAEAALRASNPLPRAFIQEKHFDTGTSFNQKFEAERNAVLSSEIQARDRLVEIRDTQLVNAGMEKFITDVELVCILIEDAIKEEGLGEYMSAPIRPQLRALALKAWSDAQVDTQLKDKTAHRDLSWEADEEAKMFGTLIMSARDESNAFNSTHFARTVVEVLKAYNQGEPAGPQEITIPENAAVLYRRISGADSFSHMEQKAVEYSKEVQAEGKSAFELLNPEKLVHKLLPNEDPEGVRVVENRHYIALPDKEKFETVRDIATISPKALHRNIVKGFAAAELPYKKVEENPWFKEAFSTKVGELLNGPGSENCKELVAYMLDMNDALEKHLGGQPMLTESAIRLACLEIGNIALQSVDNDVILDTQIPIYAAPESSGNKRGLRHDESAQAPDVKYMFGEAMQFFHTQAKVFLEKGPAGMSAEDRLKFSYAFANAAIALEHADEEGLVVMPPIIGNTETYNSINFNRTPVEIPKKTTAQKVSDWLNEKVEF